MIVLRKVHLQEVAMKKSSFLSVLLITCLLMTLFPTTLVAETTHSTLTGTISLPGNDTAPSGGVKVTLNVGTDNLTPTNKNDDKSLAQEMIIPQGQHSISYSVMVPKSTNRNAQYSVAYTTESSYAPFGWYTTGGTTAIKQDRSTVDLNGGDVNGINITMLEGKVIPVKIIAGNQTTAPLNDMKYTVTAIQEGSNASSSDDDIVISKIITMPKNSKEAGFSLIVPLNAANNGYKVYYNYQDGNYNETGYYHSTGTSRSADTFTRIDVSNTVSEINLTTLPFTNFTGRVYLPDGALAPENGTEVKVTAENLGGDGAADDIRFEKTVVIPKNANCIEYNLTIPVKQTGYTVSYTVKGNTGYIATGYFSASGTQTSKSNAALIGTGDSSISGIDLTIQKKPQPTPTPTATPTPTPAPDQKPDPKYDLNGDGSVNIKDLVELARVIAAEYKKPGNTQKDCKLNDKEIKDLRDAFKVFDNNRYGLKIFNGINQWFKNWDFGWLNNDDDDKNGFWWNWNCGDCKNNNNDKNKGNGKGK